MEFSFSQEQEELRREARGFLDANPDAPLAELRELGWIGASVPEERGGGGLSFVDEALLFEEAGRALYAGPFLTTAVVVPALAEVGDRRLVARAARARAAPRHGRPGSPRGHDRGTRRRRDARHGGRDASARPPGRLGRPPGRRGLRARAAAPARRARRRGRRRRAEGARARRRVRLAARAVRQEDRHLPGRLPPARRHVRRDRARPLARLLGRVERGGGGRAGAARRRRPRRRNARRPRSPPASGRSRCTAASASRGSTRSTATTSARSGSTRSAATRPSQREVVAAALLD